MTQTGDTNQLISHSGYIYTPSHLSCFYFSLWGHYQLDLDVLCSLKTILETLQKLKGFIIRLDMQYSNVAWKPNWTGNHLCILRPMPAHSKWITGGLSQCLRHSVLNLEKKLQEAFIFQISFPLSFTVLNSIKLSEGYLPSQGRWKWEFGSIYFWKERATGMKTSPFSILATCSTQKQSFLTLNSSLKTPNTK